MRATWSALVLKQGYMDCRGVARAIIGFLGAGFVWSLVQKVRVFHLYFSVMPKVWLDCCAKGAILVLCQG